MPRAPMFSSIWTALTHQRRGGHGIATRASNISGIRRCMVTRRTRAWRSRVKTRSSTSSWNCGGALQNSSLLTGPRVKPSYSTRNKTPDSSQTRNATTARCSADAPRHGICATSTTGRKRSAGATTIRRMSPNSFGVMIHLDETRALDPLDRNAGWERGELADTFPTSL